MKVSVFQRVRRFAAIFDLRVYQIFNQTLCALLVHIRHAFIRATARPMVRTDNPRTVAHSPWLLPAPESFRNEAKPAYSMARGSAQQWKLDWALNSEPFASTLPAGRKQKTEIQTRSV